MLLLRFLRTTILFRHVMAARVTRKDDGVCCSANTANLSGIERGTEGHPRSTVEHGTAPFGRFVKIKALR
jgi:hypothetical protein